MVSDFDARPRIVVIGGGFSGAFCAAELAEKSPAPVAITVVEPRPVLGAGVAYSATDPSHRVNVPAARMTIFPDNPADFDHWVRQNGVLEDDPEAIWDEHAYPRREVFGRYISELVARRSAARADVTIRHVQDSAVSVTSRCPGYSVALAQGGELAADFVVISTSHPAPAPPPVIASLCPHPAIIANPWAPDALAAISPAQNVLIVGTGLTMADVVASLARQHHQGRITAFSRRGQLSRGHAFVPTPFTWFANHPAPPTALGLTRKIRELVAAAAQPGPALASGDGRCARQRTNPLAKFRYSRAAALPAALALLLGYAPLPRRTADGTCRAEQTGGRLINGPRGLAARGGA